MSTNLFLLNCENDIFEKPRADLISFFSNLSQTKNSDLVKKDFLYEKSLPLNTENSGWQFICDTCTSSLDAAHFLAKQNCFMPFSSLICRSQTRGRGQLRRHWSSGEGNLYTALCLPNIYPFSSGIASVLLGAMLALTLENFGYRVELKWPNDLVQKDSFGRWKKIGGILLEEKNNYLIAGIGINLQKFPNPLELRNDYFLEAGILQKYDNMDKKSFVIDDDIMNFSDDNANYNKDIHINFLKICQFWQTLVEDIFLCYRKKILGADKNFFVELIEKFLAFKTEEVKICRPLICEKSNNNLIDLNTEYLRGRLCGVNSDGELLLQKNSEIITILGGSLSQEND